MIVITWVVWVLVVLLWIAKPWRQEPVDVVLGGLYSTQKFDGSYGIVKVLAVQENTVHLCVYKNHYRRRPRRVDPDSLSIALSTQELLHLKDTPCYVGLLHVPITLETFCHSDYVYITQTPVTPTELAWEQAEARCLETAAAAYGNDPGDTPRQVIVMERWGQHDPVLACHDNDDEQRPQIPASA
jgi:hypothetical protein